MSNTTKLTVKCIISHEPDIYGDLNVCLFVCLVGNEALSACKTIAELWDGRLRGGDIGLVSAAGGRMAAS